MHLPAHHDLRILAALSLLVPSLSLAATVPTGRNFRVNTVVESQQLLPGVAADGVGNFVVAWKTFGGISARRLTSAGVPLGNQFTVELDQTNATPVVAAGPAGNFLVVWHNGEPNIKARLFDGSGSPQGATFVVNTYTTSNQRYPSLAAGGDGSFIVAWESHQEVWGLGIFAQRLDATGAPLGGEFQVNTYTTGNQRYPSVAADSGGGFAIVWEDEFAHDGDGRGVFGRRYDSSGAPLGGEFLVSTTTVAHQDDPRVAMSPAGDFIVTWRDGSVTSQLTARRFDAAAAPLGPELQVGGSSGFSPRVAVDPSGASVVVGTRFISGSQRVVAQAYASDGTAVGAEHTLNTNLLVYRDSPAVAGGGVAGNFLAVWRDDIGDDIVAQRFSASCGNGAIGAGETCDDGNDTDGDGCGANCLAETCYACAGAPSSCSPIVACAADGCCAPGCTATNDADCPTLVAGSFVSLRQDGGQGDRRFKFKSRDAQIDTSPGTGIDPVADGASIQVYNASSTDETACFEFPTSIWQARGSASAPAFVYRDPNSLCTMARVTDGRVLRVKCSSPPFEEQGYDFDLAPQNAVAVRFKSGTEEYCSVFGGTIVEDSIFKVFIARNAPAPAACPVPPLPCPFHIDAP
jgi:cysteine-rich repeat protein